ncbi:MAG: sodium:calcium antiporter [Candidatus Thalassarchaeaceae archaeon]|tara:strand:+ start:14174 stop:15106 length:933 start_codon:yes stop_codon:yes gene_type:complete
MDEIYVILGFILLIMGAEGFVQGAVALASKFRVPPLLVGFTIVALGTSLPELAVVLEALDTDGGDDIAIGGIIGSNISNVMLVLGSAALLGASEYPGRGIRRDAVAVLIATLILVGATLFGSISQLLGVFMIFLLIAFYAYSYNHAKNHNVPPENENSMISNNLYFAIIVLFGGGVMVWLGADLLMTGVIGVMDKYGISQSVIGLTIVALGTSLPEFAVTVISALRGHGGVALGNVLGSNVMNILGILGIASVIGGGVVISSNFAQRDIWLLLLSSGLVCGMLLDNREIGRGVGLSMVLGYLTYMALLFS